MMVDSRARCLRYERYAYSVIYVHCHLVGALVGLSGKGRCSADNASDTANECAII